MFIINVFHKKRQMKHIPRENGMLWLWGPLLYDRENVVDAVPVGASPV